MGCFLLAASLVAQKEVFVPASDVSFKISTDQSNYKAGQSIMLKYRAKNASNAALFVPREWEATCPGAPQVCLV
jgi:organic hydroperoxide reductase OsmC/OhrA